MKSLFSGLTRLSIRFRWVTLALVVLVSAAGLIAVGQLRQELIPAISFPQTIILSQVTGMSSDQVLNVLTSRLETALNGVEEVVNLESTTTGSFGAVITARNDFGQDPVRLQADIRSALDGVWLPLRRIAPPAGEEASVFAARLLNDLQPDTLLYLAESDANFLFQLTPETWAALSPETARALLAYLASQVQQSTGDQTPLQRLLDQEVVPSLLNLDQVATVNINGGQVLPVEGQTALPVQTTTTTTEPRSLLLQLSPEVWAAATGRIGFTGALDTSAVEALRADATALPEGIPALPDSWQMDHFKDARDLFEMRTLTRTLGTVINDFRTSGSVIGALGQTDDLTPDTLNQMIALDPTLIQYFDAEQLAALPADVFAALPPDYIAGLDGFTRDELAAAALATSITGETAQPTPVDLPQAWRISPPQLISFSFDDLPLATFSVSGTAETLPVENAAALPEATQAPVLPEATAEPVIATSFPEGPRLPFTFGLLGAFLNIELNTADDLLNLQLPENLAQQFGANTISGAQLLNFLILLDNPEALPPGTNAPTIPGGASGLIGGLSPEVVTYLADNDPAFLSTLSPQVFDAFSDAVLALPQAAPPLDTVWDALARQPQFSTQPLTSAADIVALGDGQPAQALNTINAAVPEQFAGYEVRLLNSLTPAALRYFAAQQPDFFTATDADVLGKLSPETLSNLPAGALDALPATVADNLRAIAAGEQPSAADALAALYQTNVTPADPNAPALNPDWQFVGDFLNVELDTADDFTRFFPSASNFINDLFTSSQGISFAPNLLGGLSAEALDYMVGREPTLLDDLRIEALQLLQPSVIAGLPAEVQERIASGAEPFRPTAPATRTNGDDSLLVTVYKSDNTNTIEAYYAAEGVMDRLVEAHPGLTVNVSFEQASFIEESISGVAREGGLGAIFAVVIILIFLSSGSWARRPRTIVGLILVAAFAILLAALVFSSPNAAVGLGAAWDGVDVVVRVLLLLGIAAGVLIIGLPGNLPRPAWRSTLVSAVSIPLSVLVALALMRWLPPTVHSALLPAAEGSGIVSFLLRLFPASLTINIMTLSGLTVAIGRVVDDSIVVLENIFREIQSGRDKREAIISGTRDVSVAIFAATVITVVVFLPLGLTGGIIGEFFLPFGLAVTYALLASFFVAITVVPVLAYLLLDVREIPSEDHDGVLERGYVGVLHWAFGSPVNRVVILLIAVASLVVGGALFASRPQAFLPSFGEPQIGIAVELPAGTGILDTNAQVALMETALNSELPPGEIGTVQTIIGSAGFSLQSLILGGSGVSENLASITVAVEDSGQLDSLAGEIRIIAERVFGAGNVTVSAASLSEQGLGGFALILSGPQADLEANDTRVIEALNNVDGLANVSSNLAGFGGDQPTYIRIDGQSAARYTGELETDDTLGVTSAAKSAVASLDGLPSAISVSEGFETRLQTEGFANLFLAMGIAIAIVIVLLMLTFSSLVHWVSIILSIIVAPVGAAIALTLTNRVLGISALIGLLMLIGIVVTNAVVLIDRVQSNRRERGMAIDAALLEAGSRRLRPILMTALATIFALLPLAIGLSRGAIIASELGTVVIGGLFSSTLLTLIIVPVAYRLLDPINSFFARLVGQGEARKPVVDTKQGGSD